MGRRLEKRGGFVPGAWGRDVFTKRPAVDQNNEDTGLLSPYNFGVTVDQPDECFGFINYTMRQYGLLL
jgi:hypothetical protein